ncbi:MAG: exo-alpha-sialidase [Clostridia bacterium]|nr:exo-alpha-sialidase [Clostridia bacterium]
MVKANLFIKLITLLLVFSMFIPAFVSCDGDKNKDNDPEKKEEDLYDISGFTIIREDASGKVITHKTQKLRKTILSVTGTDLSVVSDWVKPGTAIDENGKEILIGETNRKASADALAKLKADRDNEAYIIDITENKIVIVGTTDYATARAIEDFISMYVEKSSKGTKIDISAGELIMTDYDSSNTIFASNFVGFSTIVSSTVKEAPQNTWGTGIGYPTIIELQHSGENNGKIIASFSIADSGKRGKPTSFRIMESVDGGETWKQIGEAVETIDRSIEACWNPHLFELPEQVGDMPKGTLLLAGCSIDPGQKIKSHIAIWKSLDCGKTWKEFTVVTAGGGLGEGVWEPYLYYEDGYLYCFYSDDSLPEYDQTVSYKRSKDGKTWEDIVHVVAGDKFAYRPGMGIFTKMGNGQYFIVYEIFGEWSGCPIHYKITDDITDWNPSDLGTRLTAGSYTMGSAPWCAWTPVGGECGTLIVTSKYGSATPNKILVSFDYGKTFEAIDNPLPYSGKESLGYSASLFFSADGTTLFYGNNVDGKGEKSKIAFAKIKIYE